MHPRNLYNKRPDFGELATVRPTLRPYLIPKSKQSMKQQNSDQQQSAEVSPSHPGLLPTSNDAVTLSSSGVDQEKKHQYHQATAIEAPASSSTDIDLAAEHLQESPNAGVKKFAYTLDFSDPEALRELTCAVLERDFGLKVEIPLDKLIPAVPQRLNYVHWIEDLLMCCGAGDSQLSQRGEGGGASKAADSAVGEVSMAFDNADSAISGVSQIEVERVTPSDCADLTVCIREGEAEEGVACYQKGGVVSDRANDVTVPKGDSIIGVDIGTSFK